MIRKKNDRIYLERPIPLAFSDYFSEYRSIRFAMKQPASSMSYDGEEVRSARNIGATIVRHDGSD
jgi:hypothetical protein